MFVLLHSVLCEILNQASIEIAQAEEGSNLIACFREGPFTDTVQVAGIRRHFSILYDMPQVLNRIGEHLPLSRFAFLSCIDEFAQSSVQYG